MPKAYWIAHVDVRDPERYKDYVAAARPAFERHGARFLARGGEKRPTIDAWRGFPFRGRLHRGRRRGAGDFRIPGAGGRDRFRSSRA